MVNKIYKTNDVPGDTKKKNLNTSIYTVIGVEKPELDYIFMYICILYFFLTQFSTFQKIIIRNTHLLLK